MAKKRGLRHKLLVYRRMGQRWRTPTLLLVLMGALLYVLGWLAAQGKVQGLNTGLINSLWERRLLLMGLIGFSLLLYIITLIIASSHVEVQAKALYVRAGLIAQHISYGRISQMRIVQLNEQYPAQQIKARDYRMLEPFYELPCTAIDLRSWPKTPLRKLWHPMMFTRDGRNSLLFIVEDAMVLNQQIDGALSARQARYKKRGQYEDPIERAARQARKSRRS